MLDCKSYCDWYDEEVCKRGRCACDEAQARAMEEYYGLTREDPLDKNATDISVWDVYSPSELL